MPKKGAKLGASSLEDMVPVMLATEGDGWRVVWAWVVVVEASSETAGMRPGGW